MSGNVVSEAPTIHNINHKTLSEHEVQVNTVRVNAKRKCEEEDCARPSKLIKTTVRTR